MLERFPSKASVFKLNHELNKTTYIKMAGKINLTDQLKKYFGFDNFKGNQEPIIQNLLDGNDTFVLMPTGGGKSLCYQLPSLLMEGTAIVISPLIALMKNQVDAMRNFSEEDGVAHFINSSLNKGAIDQVRSDILAGKTKLLYVAPESLTKEENVEFLRSVKISFYAVDEAHCISEWGHDFRPEYRRIRPIINEIGKAPLIALTATATPKVQHDIQKNLGMVDAHVFKSSFNRPNLYYEVRPKTQNVDKDIIKFIKNNPEKSGIIYCLSRKKVEELAEILQANGINARAYHAGMDSATRTQNQDNFLMEKIDVIVATIAFGMGIDKPDVRFVVHYNMPKNLENYYQEAGRAGRDGENSDCILLYSPGDVHTQKFFIENNDENAELTEEQREKIKKNDYYKLNEMVGYCTSTTCLRNYILNYFGEYHTNECKNCSACLKEYKLADVTVDSQKILSCIIRTGQRFGTSTISAVLAGSKSENIYKYRLNNQSTYGIMSDKLSTVINELITRLIDEEYITQTEDKYPVLKVTQKSYPILKGQKSLTMRLAVKEELHREIQHTEVDKVLFDKLKERRKYLADKASVPPYVIFSDASLRDMCAKLPTNENDFLRISGVVIKKHEKYAKEFIQIIKEYKEEKF